MEETAKKTTAAKTTAKKSTAATKKTTSTAEKKPATKATTAKKTATKATAPKKTTTTKTTAPKAEVKVEAPATAVAKKPAKNNGKMVKITLVRSTNGILEKQKRTVVALGLRKIRSSVVKPDNACTRGMIYVVNHLVKVEEV